MAGEGGARAAVEFGLTSNESAALTTCEKDPLGSHLVLKGQEARHVS